MPMLLAAGRGIDLSAVARTSQPTRDVLVTRSLDGDRTFAGFGKAKANGASTAVDARIVHISNAIYSARCCCTTWFACSPIATLKATNAD